MLTNRSNLPQEIVDAIKNDKYSSSGAYISATGLLNPIQKTILSRRHFAEIEEDVTDRIWSLLGRGIHSVLENSKSENSLKEERLTVEVLGKKLSGQFDHYSNGIITDYKLLSVWSRIHESRNDEWEAQQNIYSFLLSENGFDVTGLRILAIFRDWNKHKIHEPNYPEFQAEIIPLTLWTKEKQKEFITERMQKLIDAENIPDENLPECSPSETWESPAKFAVTKKGNKRATKLCDSEDEAKEYISEQKGFEIIHRPGERKRCENYCEVKNFCEQYKKYKSVSEKI